MRKSEYNANRDLYEAAMLRGMPQPRRRVKGRAHKRPTWKDRARRVAYPGTAAGLALRLCGLVMAAMSLSAMVH